MREGREEGLASINKPACSSSLRCRIRDGSRPGNLGGGVLAAIAGDDACKTGEARQGKASKGEWELKPGAWSLWDALPQSGLEKVIKDSARFLHFAASQHVRPYLLLALYMCIHGLGCKKHRFDFSVQPPSLPLLPSVSHTTARMLGAPSSTCG
jgi:hypothetical protein